MRAGFPHSEIRGSKLVRSSPRLIAAYHVLHRLSTPRHPPNALKALDHSHYQCPPRHQTRRSLNEERPDYFCSRFAHGSPSCPPDTTRRLRSTRHVHASPIAGQIFLFTMSTNPRQDEPVEFHKSRTCRNPRLATPQKWWSRTGSNRRPPACKAGALPIELRPLNLPDAASRTLILDPGGGMVGLGRLELPTSRLSGVRSNHLSYRPDTGPHPTANAQQRPGTRASGRRAHMSSRTPTLRGRNSGPEIRSGRKRNEDGAVRQTGSRCHPVRGRQSGPMFQAVTTSPSGASAFLSVTTSLERR